MCLACSILWANLSSAAGWKEILSKIAIMVSSGTHFICIVKNLESLTRIHESQSKKPMIFSEYWVEMLLFFWPEVTSGPCSWQMMLLFCCRLYYTFNKKLQDILIINFRSLNQSLYTTKDVRKQNHSVKFGDNNLWGLTKHWCKRKYWVYLYYRTNFILGLFWFNLGWFSLISYFSQPIRRKKKLRTNLG